MRNEPMIYSGDRLYRCVIKSVTHRFTVEYRAFPNMAQQHAQNLAEAFERATGEMCDVVREPEEV